MRFIAMEITIRIIVCLRPLVEIVRQNDSKLAGQITTAGSSISLNLGEGDRRTGRDRKHFFKISSGSAEEVRTALRVAVAWGYLKEESIREVLEDIDQYQAIMWKLTR